MEHISGVQTVPRETEGSRERLPQVRHQKIDKYGGHNSNCIFHFLPHLSCTIGALMCRRSIVSVNRVLIFIIP